MDTFILKIILKFLQWIPLPSVNMDQLKIIVSTKLIMDRRRKPATLRQNKEKEGANNMLYALIMYSILGLFMGIMIFTIPSIMVVMIVLHSYFLFMLIMTMITDFSNVLLDTSDSLIILPKPISGKTLLVARTIHIIVYLSQLILALMIFPLVFTFIKYGILVGCAVIITILLTTAVGLFTSYILYGLVLRFTSEQKIKDIISYFQIFMTIFFAVGYQVIPRLINLKQISFDYHLSWYSYLLPPVWMASLLEALHSFNFDSIHILMIILALLVPVIAGFIVKKILAPYFSQSISRLNANNDKSSVAEKKTGIGISEKLSKFICNNDYEKAAFSKVWKITSREKNFRLQFYPGLAYIPVFIFIVFFKDINNAGQTWRNMNQGDMFVWLLYIGIFSITGGLMIIKYSENFSAAWVYQSAPITKPGEIISGTMKALLVKFFVPVYIIMAACTFFVWGIKVWDDVLLAFFSNILIFYIIALLSEHYLPFSQQQTAKDQAGRFVRVMLQMILITVLVGIHYIAIKLGWLVLALIPVIIIGLYFSMHRIKKLSWNEIKM
jgi:ABC-2 type transport system permease protein